MLKLKAILLLCIFLITNSGMAVTLHWCGGKLTSIEVCTLSSHHCPCGKKAMKADCCKEVTSTFQIKGDLEKTTQFLFQTNQSSQPVEIPALMVFIPALNVEKKVSDVYHPPPFKPKAPLFILDRVILI